jgi:uncharacterized protein (TIGR03083 family)
LHKDRIVAALDEVWSSLGELLQALDEEEWSRPSPLPGWTVQDNVAHIVGTELMLAGEQLPSTGIDRTTHPHVRNQIGELNEAWVESFRGRPPADVLADFEAITAARLESLREMSDEEWAAEAVTPAGPSTYGRFMQIRVFDCWLHEQDIRDATGRPGDELGLAVEVTLDEMVTAMGFVVGKRAGVEPGRSVTFELTDGGAVVRVIDVEVAERAAVVDRLDGPATVTIRLPVGVMTRLCAGRAPLDELRERIELSGDVELGERVIANLTYTI